MSRLASFVRAARALLWMQVAAALIAAALGLWAVFAVRDLATERDALAARVAELERDRPEAPASTIVAGPPSSPLDTEVRPPAIMPIFFPIVADPAVTPEIPPVDIPPPDPGTGSPQTPPTSGADCSGPNPDRQSCRPGRWSRRDPPPVAAPSPASDQPRPGADQPRPDPS